MKNKSIVISFSVLGLIILTTLFYFLNIHEKVNGLHGLGNMEQSYVFSSSIGDYAISIPSEWNIHVIRGTPDNMQYLIETGSSSSIGSPNAYINISKPKDSLLGIFEIFSYIDSYKKGFDQFLDISKEELVIGENKGFLIEYTFLEHQIIGNYKNHCYEWVLTNKVGYIFSFCIMDSFWKYGNPMFIKMIESIKID